MELLKRIFNRINASWRRKQEESIREEWKILAGAWEEHRPRRWSEFKSQNAKVNAYLDRVV